MSDQSARILQPPGWPRPGGYANGISVAAGRIVFFAGQVGWDTQEKFHSEELVPQFEQALKNIIAIVAEAGGEPHHICRITAFCIDKPAYLAGRREIGRIWRTDGQSLCRDEHDLRRRSARPSGSSSRQRRSFRLNRRQEAPSANSLATSRRASAAAARRR
jgi:enamine deaminase RidA (YjgF/YER057c/UK114 family)